MHTTSFRSVPSFVACVCTFDIGLGFDRDVNASFIVGTSFDIKIIEEKLQWIKYKLVMFIRASINQVSIFLIKVHSSSRTTLL